MNGDSRKHTEAAALIEYDMDYDLYASRWRTHGKKKSAFCNLVGKFSLEHGTSKTLPKNSNIDELATNSDSD